MPSNIIFYPYNEPIILTDDIFVAYGGYVGSSTPSQRGNAYTIAEERVSAHLRTFLTPTIVTGTYVLHSSHPLTLDHTYVRQLLGVTIYSRNRDSSCTLQSNSSCAYLRDAKRGILDVNLKGSCSCGNAGFDPYQIEVAYEDGLASGTSYQSSLVRALAVEAQIELNEMGVASVNETTGDVGVESFSNQEYSERRVALKKTALGSSAMSNYAERLLRRFVVRQKIGL